MMNMKFNSYSKNDQKFAKLAFGFAVMARDNASSSLREDAWMHQSVIQNDNLREYVRSVIYAYLQF